MRYFRVFNILISMAVLIVAFNNCSSPPAASRGAGSAERAQNSDPSLAFNGGGYSGKVSFLYFSNTDAPTCNGELYQADSRIDYDRGTYTRTEGLCSGNPTSFSVAPARNTYNPYYLIDDEKVYFLNGAQTALPPNKRVVNYALCSSTAAARPVDVIIRVEKTWNSVRNLWETQTKGHKIAPGENLLEERGQLKDPDANGTIEYGFPHQGDGTIYPTTFGVRLFNFGTAFKTPGEIYINSDFTSAVPADCYSIRN